MGQWDQARTSFTVLSQMGQTVLSYGGFIKNPTCYICAWMALCTSDRLPPLSWVQRADKFRPGRSSGRDTAACLCPSLVRSDDANDRFPALCNYGIDNSRTPLSGWYISCLCSLSWACSILPASCARYLPHGGSAVMGA